MPLCRLAERSNHRLIAQEDKEMPIITAICGVASFAVLGQNQQSQSLIEESIDRRAVAARREAEATMAGRPEWNPGFNVLFKGKIVGQSTTAPQRDGKSYFTLLVKTSNGGVAMVELGPGDYVEAQGLRFQNGAEIWVSGSKTWSGDDSIILAQRINYGGFRPSFRKADGAPFWR